MKKYVALNKNGFIVSTSDVMFPQNGQEVFDFPNDFDFSKQGEYKIIDGELINASDESKQLSDAEYLKSLSYEEKVVALIREKYSLDEELAIQRQRDTKPDEFKTYFDYCEECKERAKGKLEK